MDLRLKKIFAASLSVFLSISLFTSQASAEKREIAKPEMEVRVKGKLTVDGKEFKDLNGNGKLDPYENWQLSDDERVKDLVSQMTLEEKAGLLLIPEFPAFKEGKLVLPNKMINQNTRYFIFRETPGADVIASYNNQLQDAAEESRLGIPVVIISNPRNHAEALAATGKINMEEAWSILLIGLIPLGLAATTRFGSNR